MELIEREATRDLLLLSLTAGSADAVGFLGLGRVFTSNMTGNFVLLGIDLGQGQFEAAARDLYVLGIFISGLCLGAWLGRGVPEKKWQPLAFRLIGLEKILLFAFAVAWFISGDKTTGVTSYGLISLLALAMGLQSAALFRLSAPGVVTTAVTGTITALTTGLVNLLFLTKTDAAQKGPHVLRIQFQFSVILLYGFGAAISGFLIIHATPWAGLLPILAATFVSWGWLRHEAD